MPPGQRKRALTAGQVYIYIYYTFYMYIHIHMQYTCARHCRARHLGGFALRKLHGLSHIWTPKWAWFPFRAGEFEDLATLLLALTLREKDPDAVSDELVELIVQVVSGSEGPERPASDLRGRSASGVTSARWWRTTFGHTVAEKSMSEGPA